jgi:hypothetical protein
MLATAAGPLADPHYASPLTELTLPHLLRGQLDNNWGMVFGLPGVLQLGPLAVVLLLLGAYYWRGTSRHATLADADAASVAGVVGNRAG